jgi:hypothetical protein
MAKTVRTAPAKQPSRAIKRFAPPSPPPPMPSQKSSAASNKLAADTIRQASNPHGIDPTQQRF